MIACTHRGRRPHTMYLSRHRTAIGPRWALDGSYLPPEFTLERLLDVPAADIPDFLEAQSLGDVTEDPELPPVERGHEVWASGVTYQRSREARELESTDADAYERVYHAERPELFFKAPGWRVVGPGDRVRVRGDSRWNVPEPELVLVVNSEMEIVGYTAGNDVSSRDIEGENPLYLHEHQARGCHRFRGRDRYVADEALFRGACGLSGQGARLPRRSLSDDRHGDSTRGRFHAGGGGPGGDLGRGSRAGERGGVEAHRMGRDRVEREDRHLFQEEDLDRIADRILELYRRRVGPRGLGRDLGDSEPLEPLRGPRDHPQI